MPPIPPLTTEQRSLVSFLLAVLLWLAECVLQAIRDAITSLTAALAGQGEPGPAPTEDRPRSFTVPEIRAILRAFDAAALGLSNPGAFLAHVFDGIVQLGGEGPPTVELVRAIADYAIGAYGDHDGIVFPRLTEEQIQAVYGELLRQMGAVS